MRAGFPTFCQIVDSLGMTAAEEKLEAIAYIEFPTDLSDLNYYIGLTQ